MKALQIGGIVLVLTHTTYSMEYQMVKEKDVLAFHKGMEACERGELDRAHSLFMQVHKKKASAVALKYLARCYETHKNLEKALKCYQEAARKGSVVSLVNAGVLHAQQGDMEQAKECFQEAANKDNRKGIYNLGLLYYIIGDYETAKTQFQRAINKGSLFALRMLIHIGKETCNNPVAYLHRVKEPNVINEINNLGVASYDAHKKARAKKYFQLAAQHGHPGACNNLGILYEEKGKDGKARVYYKMAIAKGNEEAEGNLMLLETLD